MLYVEGLTKRYAKVAANDQLCFDVQSGEITVMAGPNGAGKSTAIKCITGLLRYEGVITIGGEDNRSIAAKRLLGFVPEVPYLYDMLTVREHLSFIARAYRLDEGWKPRADALLQRLELGEQADKLGKELSKGMQQKVSIACALLHDPALLLLDEPLVGLDPHAIKELKAILREQRDAGKAIMISTHILDSVEDLWDKVLILQHGRIAAQRTRSELEHTGESLEALFFEITEAPSGGEAAV